MRLFKRYGTLAKFIGESAEFALYQLKADKFRTFLSLLGVSIGVFSIVAVLTVIDSLKRDIHEGFDSFGSNLVFIEQYPNEPDEDGTFRWWDYTGRPPVSFEDYRYLSENGEYIGSLCYNSTWQTEISGGRNNVVKCDAIGVAGEWQDAVKCGIASGRSFSATEINNGSNVAIIGTNISKALFGDQNMETARSVKIGGNELSVTGIFESSGNSSVSIINTDDAVVIPFKYAKFLSLGGEASGMICAAPIHNRNKGAFLDEIILLLRNRRRLTPHQKDNFSINSLSGVISKVEEIFSNITLAGWIIGCFSLLTGAFGIANIMYVSVKERTRQIGIQKALGCRKNVILLQFLTESALLSLAGGIAGIFILYLGTLLLKGSIIDISLTVNNTLKGILLSLLTGILAGILPARSASSKIPVEAMNN